MFQTRPWFSSAVALPFPSVDGAVAPPAICGRWRTRTTRPHLAVPLVLVILHPSPSPAKGRVEVPLLPTAVRGGR
uniref:Uncharacterized protein n=1 Tax=Setaria viridis TaxID=4556 RepID=A0A4U6V3Y0_SETVI|nr:hypothetical protein SEVIR_4G253101v2 [Setaria viridis]